MSSSVSFGDKLQEILSRRGTELAKVLSAKGSEAEAKMSKVGDTVRKNAEKAAENVKAEQQAHKEGDKKKVNDAAKKSQSPQGKKQPAKEPCKTCGDGNNKLKCPEPGGLGTLSAKYESGPKGSAAIGYDSTGGKSYGKYQISTQRGTMQRFLARAKTRSPDIYEKLESAGGNKAALEGDKKFQDAWIECAKNPEFGKLEQDVMREINYQPQVDKVRQDIGLDVNQRSSTLRDIVWSISIQHGPTSRVITNALNNKDIENMSDEQIIDTIYKERSLYIKKEGEMVPKYFINNTKREQASSIKRVLQEYLCAKHMLSIEKS